MKLLILFIFLNVINVILQTIKSIATVKCGKATAALVNAIAYGLYTVVLVYMNCDLSLLAKVAVVGGTNLIGVYIVKVLEERVQKERLWKVEATITKKSFETNKDFLVDFPVSHNFIDLDSKYTILNFYCKSKEESRATREILNNLHAKYFVTESKAL